MESYDGSDVPSTEEDDQSSARSEESDTEQEMSDDETGAEFSSTQTHWIGKNGKMWSVEPDRTNIRRRSM